jgi:hypothetical protein
MKHNWFWTNTLCGLLLAAPAGMVSSALAAAPATNAPAANQKGTGAPWVQPRIPQSVFVAAKTPGEGRDPFFPNSTRAGAAPQVASSSKSAASVVTSKVNELKLKGIIGGGRSRMAIINNREMLAGEEGDVLCTGTKVRVRVLEIREDSAVILVGSERLELKLRSGF